MSSFRGSGIICDNCGRKIFEIYATIEGVRARWKARGWRVRVPGNILASDFCRKCVNSGFDETKVEESEAE